jgi:hypothetical protein
MSWVVLADVFLHQVQQACKDQIVCKCKYDKNSLALGKSTILKKNFHYAQITGIKGVESECTDCLDTIFQFCVDLTEEVALSFYVQKMQKMNWNKSEVV